HPRCATLFRSAVLPADRPRPHAEEGHSGPGAHGREEDQPRPDHAVRLAVRGADPPRAGPAIAAGFYVTRSPAATRTPVWSSGTESSFTRSRPSSRTRRRLRCLTR